MSQRRARGVRGAILAIVVALAAPTAAARAATRDDLAAAEAVADPLARRSALEAIAKGPRDTAEGKDLAARASFRLGELAEKERRFADAIARYRDVLAVDPGNWFAAAARARVEVLSAYEGAFDELAALDAVRKDPARASDPAALDALARAAASWRGRARGEALLFVAEAWTGRVGQPAKAIAPALAAARDPRVERAQRDAGWDLAWAALRAVGDLDRANREIAQDPGAPEPIKKRVRRDVRRRTLQRTSTVVASATALAGAAALVTAIGRRRGRVVLDAATRPLAVAFLLLTPLLAAVLADAWDRGMGAHFAPFAAALLGVHLFAASWRGAFGDRARAARMAGGLAAALAVIAAAYLVLARAEARGTPLLESFGL